MRLIVMVAKNTFREIIRDRILYGLLVFAALLMGLSLAIGELSFAEQVRISENFGLAGIQLCSVILSIFIGCSLVAKEIEKQTILTILSRPISRGEFLFGKYIGLLGVILAMTVGLGLILLALLLLLKAEVNGVLLTALYGIFLESMILLSLALVFGMLSKPILAACYSLGFFLIGHWIGDLTFFSKKSSSEGFRFFSDLLSKSLPNLERFNWRAAVIYNDTIVGKEISVATAYALGWSGLLIFICWLLFRRKDFI